MPSSLTERQNENSKTFQGIDFYIIFLYFYCSFFLFCMKKETEKVAISKLFANTLFFIEPWTNFVIF
jgi:hypothetical protein